MPLLPLGDLRYHYRDIGTGETLLLLSGMASDGASWQPMLESLVARFRVILPDQRCTGQTTPSDITSSREAMLDDIVALLDALQLRRVHLIGHSMGAMLGWSLAARRPDRVRSLVTMSAPPATLPARVDLFRTLARLPGASASPDWFRLLFQFLFSPRFFEDAGEVEAAARAAVDYEHRQAPQALARQAEALASFQTPPDTAAVTCPVLAITGEHDLLFSPQALTATVNAYPVTRHQVIPAAAHALHWENPDAVLETIARFHAEEVPCP